MLASRVDALVARALRHEVALLGRVEVVQVLRAATCALFADSTIEAHEQHCVREAARLPEEERDVQQSAHQHEAHADHNVRYERRDPRRRQLRSDAARSRATGYKTLKPNNENFHNMHDYTYP